jgi:23S rRNA G2445 N2-methylase RlmL
MRYREESKMSEEAQDWQKALVDESLYLRGRIVASYSQVEYLLADISFKLDQKFLYPVRERVKAAKRIGERLQFAAYKDELDAICDELSRFEEIRHFMAHAFLTLHVDRAGNHQFEYRMYKRSDGDFVPMAGTTTIDRLRNAAIDITAYVERAMDLFKKIYQEQEIEVPGHGPALT